MSIHPKKMYEHVAIDSSEESDFGFDPFAQMPAAPLTPLAPLGASSAGCNVVPLDEQAKILERSQRGPRSFHDVFLFGRLGASGG